MQPNPQMYKYLYICMDVCLLICIVYIHIYIYGKDPYQNLGFMIFEGMAIWQSCKPPWPAGGEAILIFLIFLNFLKYSPVL